MPQRIFTSDDQLAFARLSGDYNPLHLDSVLARRLLFGRRVVHGLHTLLWSLDHHLKARTRPLELRTVKANFQSGIGLGETVSGIVARQDDDRVVIQLETDGTPAAWFEIYWRPQLRRTTDPPTEKLFEQGTCRERRFKNVASASGTIGLYFSSDLAAGLFPNLYRLLPAMQLAVLLATTRLVGMECPGYHSIYSGLNLAFSADRDGVSNLRYQVTDCNQRLALVAMDIEAAGATGQVNAFLRPQPQSQAAFTEVSRQVKPEEFAAQRALVVGGSRGLGEVTAKLLAAGGAEVILTYYRGQDDARRIIEEIVSDGFRADCLPLNILKPPPALPSRIAGRSKPLYLYYFATPHIFGAAKGRFSTRRFAGFSEYYVNGFLRTVQAVADRTSSLQKIFYPSSAAIEELPLDMGEYAAAKMAGEILCDFLQKTHSGIVIHKPRLPRLATDQTVSLLPVSNQQPVSVLLSHLRDLREM